MDEWIEKELLLMTLIDIKICPIKYLNSRWVNWNLFCLDKALWCPFATTCGKYKEEIGKLAKKHKFYERMEAEGGKSGKGKTPAKRLVLFSIFFLKI